MTDGERKRRTINTSILYISFLVLRHSIVALSAFSYLLRALSKCRNNQRLSCRGAVSIAQSRKNIWVIHIFPFMCLACVSLPRCSITMSTSSIQDNCDNVCTCSVRSIYQMYIVCMYMQYTNIYVCIVYRTYYICIYVHGFFNHILYFAISCALHINLDFALGRFAVDCYLQTCQIGNQKRKRTTRFTADDP